MIGLLMAVILSTGVFLTGTAAAGNTVSVTGVLDQRGNAFDPSAFSKKVLILWWSGRVSTLGQSETDSKWGAGYAISTTDRGCSTSQSDHGNGTMATDCALYDDACIATIGIAGGVDGKMDFDAWLTNGFRLIVDDNFANSYEVNYLIITGDDLKDAASVTVSWTTLSDQNVTSLSFQPDLAFIFGGPGHTSVTINTIQVSSCWSFGAVDSDLRNYVLAASSEDAAGTSNTNSYCFSGECFAVVAPVAPALVVEERASITAWLSNGFTWHPIEVVGAVTKLVRVLCLRGLDAIAGDILTATTLATITEGVATDPQGALFLSHGKAQSAVNVSQSHDERSMGCLLLNKTQNYASQMDKSGSNAADCGIATNTTGCYANQSTAATIAIEGVMGSTTLLPEPFVPGGEMTTEMTDADPSQAFVWYVCFGEKADPSKYNRPFGTQGYGQQHQLLSM